MTFHSSRFTHYLSRFTLHASRFTLHASRLADGALLIVALIWGSTFVMVKDAVTAYPVFSFLALRFAFATLVLLPVILLRCGSMRTSGESPPTSLRAGEPTAQDWERPPAKQSPGVFIFAAPLLMGLALFAGYALQTFGLRLTTPAKAGFITGLSVVIVPVVSTVTLTKMGTRLPASAMAAWLASTAALACSRS